MSNLAKVFEFERNEVRTIIKNDEPWFVAKDVCVILGIKNSRDALQKLDDDEKDDVGLTDTIGRFQNTNIVNESGLYNLIFSSKKEGAKKFRRWVTHEVLPTIRKTGAYRLPSEQSVEISRIISETISQKIPLILETLQVKSSVTEYNLIKKSALPEYTNAKDVINEYIKLHGPIRQDKDYYFIKSCTFKKYCNQSGYNSNAIWKEALLNGLISTPYKSNKKAHSKWCSEEGKPRYFYFVIKDMLAN